MALVDPDGRPITLADKPPFVEKGNCFEGEVKITRYNDRVIVKGKCWWCGHLVVQTLHIADPAAIKPEDETALNKIAIHQLQQNHDCQVKHDGKDTIDDFIRKVGGAAGSVA